MNAHNHEYTLFARPYARLRVAFGRDDRGLAALSVSIDYDRAGLPEIAESEPPDPHEIGWQGLEFDVYRNGERLLDGTASDVDTEALLVRLEELSAYARRLGCGLKRRRDR